MYARLFTGLIAGLATTLALAGQPQPGSRLDDLTISDRGELVLSGGDVGYQSWNYPQAPGKVHVLQYMAATRSASEINKPFRERMKTELPQGGEFLSSTILNLDEAIWGTSGLVVSELKSNKQTFPLAVIVADEEGVGRRQWDLQEDSAAVMVIDPQGVVQFFKQGAMTPAEIDSTLALIRNYIVAEGSASAGQP
jgi:YtfJ family uncharacterized protein